MARSAEKSKAETISIEDLALGTVEGERIETEYAGDKSTVSAKVRQEITSLAELVEFFKIDLEIWEVERWIANQWQMASVDKDSGGVNLTPLYQVKAWLKKRVAAISARCEIEATLDEARRAMKSKPWVLTPTRRSQRKAPGSLLVLAIMDPHFGKLCWGRETGWEDYDVSVARECMRSAVADLLEQASAMPYPIGELLIPIGNDFFHVDSSANMTTGGTPQDVDGRRQRSYRAGREAVMEMIAAAVQIAPVKVSIVPGNHDEETMFALGDALELVFENSKHVTVDNAPKLTKYHEFHQCLIGLNHGRDIKPARLGGVMATEQREAWGRTKWREWLIGHWHTKGEAVLAPVSEDVGVRVRTIPSLTPPDAWHSRKGYIGNVRAAEALVYHPEAGYRAQFSHVPQIKL
jgi:hypothetical protein